VKTVEFTDDMNTEIASLDHTDPNFQSVYGKVLNFIHYQIEEKDLRKELINYAFSLGRENAAEKIPSSNIGIEGSIAYCINRGALLGPKSIQRVMSLLDSVGIKEVEQPPEWENLPDNIKVKAIQAYISCYSRIDNAKTRVLKGKLNPRELAAEVRSIINLYSGDKTATIRQLFDHYKEAATDARVDPCTKEWVKPLGTIVDTLSLLVSNRGAVKSSAKGAKAHKMNATVQEADRKGQKAASKITYKDEDAVLGIRSVDPTNVVGADAAVIFNTKNRHCEIYFAKEGMKLSVQGARIANYDEALSVGKTLRKPESDLPHWTKAASRKRLDVLMKDINGKSWELTGKLNKNTLIIKVIYVKET
jgi:hypothetical protein